MKSRSLVLESGASLPAMAVLASFAAAFRSAFRSMLAWHQRRVTRRALLALDDHLLRDIGLSRSDIAEMDRNP